MQQPNKLKKEVNLNSFGFLFHFFYRFNYLFVNFAIDYGTVSTWYIPKPELEPTFFIFKNQNPNRKHTSNYYNYRKNQTGTKTAENYKGFNP